MTRFFTSDLHWSHRLVSALRGFGYVEGRDITWADTDAHDRKLKENWWKVVQPDDEVWVLGDLSINSGPHVAEIMSTLPGRKHLISGNHDNSHTVIGRKKVEATIEAWSPIFETILDETEIDIAGRTVTLSHFPYWSWGDGPDVTKREPNFVPRFEKLRPWESSKSILLHGHTHGTETAHGRSFHVGLDAHGLELVPEQTIIDWIETLD